MTDERAEEIVGFLQDTAREAHKSEMLRDAADLREAANEIRRLRKALKPFAVEWEAISASNPRWTPHLANCHRAAEVLK